MNVKNSFKMEIKTIYSKNLIEISYKLEVNAGENKLQNNCTLYEKPLQLRGSFKHISD